jgi:hypothetical protein
VQWRGVRPSVGRRDPDEEVVRSDLGVLDFDVEVAILGEDAGVDEFVFRLLSTPPPVLLDEVGVWKRPLRVLVKTSQVGMARRRVEVPVVFLDVLAVVSLAAGQAEQPLLEYRIDAVPEGQGEAEPLLLVRDSEEAIFSPAIDARASIVVREVVPGGAEL